jgi:hypothetical protein
MNSSAGQSELLNTSQAQTVLKRQARRLKKCIEDELDRYYSSYNPKQYNRTYLMENFMYIDDIVDIDTSSGMLSINIDMDNYGAYRSASDGFVMFSNQTAYLPQLLNDGWTVKKPVSFRDTYHAGYYEGSHFIDNGIAQWKSGNCEGVVILESNFRPF